MTASSEPVAAGHLVRVDPDGGAGSPFVAVCTVVPDPDDPGTAVVKGYLSAGPMLLAHGRAVHAELRRLGYRAMRYERRHGDESRWHTVKL